MKKLLIPLFILVVIVALVAMIPATVADQAVASATAKQWRLAEAAGTLWNGHASVAVKANSQNDNSGYSPVTSLYWKFEWASLLTLSPKWRIGNSENQMITEISLSSSAFEAKPLNLSFNVAPLSKLMPTKTAQAFGGELTVSSSDLKFVNGKREGDVKAQWQNAALMINNQAIHLGTVDVALGATQAVISNRGGDVAIQGTAQLNPNGLPRGGNVTLTPNPQTPASVKHLMSILGTPDKNGVVHVNF